MSFTLIQLMRAWEQGFEAGQLKAERDVHSFATDSGDDVAGQTAPGHLGGQFDDAGYGTGLGQFGFRHTPGGIETPPKYGEPDERRRGTWVAPREGGYLARESYDSTVHRPAPPSGPASPTHCQKEI